MTDRYIAGVPCWVDLTPHDVDAAQAFYGGLFGWEFEERTPPNAPARYAYARIDGETVAAIGSRQDESVEWNTYVRVDDVDKAVDLVWAAGGDVVVPATDLGPGGVTGRMAMVKDIEGALLGLWQAGENTGAERVNVHGSVNFNDLHTRDSAAAETFYGTVFGWERINIGVGEAWALPAYGDFLEQRNPGNRERQAEFGAPLRFEEAVATLSPILEGSEGKARWEVTFAVDDADAIAARAEELGGEVVQKPTELPWVRMTVIRDPQGAVFTASQFTGAP